MLHGYKYHTSTTVSPPHISTAISSGQGQAAAIQLSSPATHVLWTYSWLKTDSWHFLPSVHTLHISHIISFGHPACFVLSFSSHSDILHKNPSFDSCFFTYFVYFYQSNRFHTLSTRFLPHFHRASASSVSPWAFCLGPRGNRCLLPPREESVTASRRMPSRGRHVECPRHRQFAQLLATPKENYDRTLKMMTNSTNHDKNGTYSNI